MDSQDIQPASDAKSHRPRVVIRNNPVLAKELRGLIRQKRSRVVLTFYLIVVAVIAFLLYISIVSTNTITPDPDVRRTLGKTVFLSITLVQLIGIIFTAPLFSADSITIEREDKTFDLLRTTSVSASSIVRGKLLAGIMFTLLLPLISLPLQGSAFLLGGISPLEFLLTILILVTTTIFLCSVSIYASSRSGRTSSAVGLAYTVSSTILLGFPILAYVIIKLAPFPSDQGFFDMLHSISKNLDPIPQIIPIIVVWILVSSNPISAAVVSYNLFLEKGIYVLYDLEPNFQITFPFVVPWIIFVIIYMFTSWIFYQSSVRRIAKSNKL